MSYLSGQQKFFLPAEGIEPEVIGADLEVYVGCNAQVRADRVRLHVSSDFECPNMELVGPRRVYHSCSKHVDHGR
jgi:hypothetical protein